MDDADEVIADPPPVLAYRSTGPASPRTAGDPGRFRQFGLGCLGLPLAALSSAALIARGLTGGPRCLAIVGVAEWAAVVVAGLAVGRRRVAFLEGMAVGMLVVLIVVLAGLTVS